MEFPRLEIAMPEFPVIPMPDLEPYRLQIAEFRSRVDDHRRQIAAVVPADPMPQFRLPAYPKDAPWQIQLDLYRAMIAVEWQAYQLQLKDWLARQ